MMKRTARRLIAIVVGAALGLWAGGFMQRATLAEELHDREVPAAEQPLDLHAEHEHDKVAGELVPDADDAAFMRPVVWAAVGLFAAAVILGIPALKLRGPEPPDPAAAAHDDHGHDDHSHGHH